jgi:hypothetical protein
MQDVSNLVNLPFFLYDIPVFLDSHILRNCLLEVIDISELFKDVTVCMLHGTFESVYNRALGSEKQKCFSPLPQHRHRNSSKPTTLVQTVSF